MSRFMEQPEGEVEKTTLGMSVQELTPQIAQGFQLKETAGVVVVQVEQGSPAADSGIRPGDIIDEINGVAIQNLKEYQVNTAELKAGSAVRFLVKRRSKTMYVVVE